jgi:nitrogen fixation protein FixH
MNGDRIMSATMPPPARTLWRFFPWFLTAGLGVVVLVNVGMAYMAIHTFPGVVDKTAGAAGLAATAPRQVR